jgi:hypothetical protein
VISQKYGGMAAAYNGVAVTPEKNLFYFHQVKRRVTTFAKLLRQAKSWIVNGRYVSYDGSEQKE